LRMLGPTAISFLHIEQYTKHEYSCKGGSP
jgi:hypothetical protein